MKNSATRPCKGCGGSGNNGRRIFRREGIPSGMECGATCSGPSGHPTYGGLICGAPAVWRDTTRNAGDGGFYDHGDLLAFVCDEHAHDGLGEFRPENAPQSCPACLGSGSVTDGPFRRDAEVDAESLRLARQDCLADYQTGRVDALDFVRAGNMLAEAK
jgi:hypothetical protein